jgi:hypothetical protein
MTPPDQPSNAYTHAPRLHPNLLLGGLQLLAWLYLYPSAWRHHLARIAPALHPDFTLTELRREQWRSPDVRRFLLMGYLVWPLLVGALLGLLLVVWGVSGIDAASGAVASVMVLVTGSIVGSMTISMAAGLATTFIGSVVGCILSASAGYNAATFMIMCGLGFGLIGGVVGTVASRLTDQHVSATVLQRLSGATLGLLLGGGLVVLGYWAVGGITLGDDGLTIGVMGNVMGGLRVGGLLAGAHWLVLSLAHRWHLRAASRRLLIGGLLGLTALDLVVGLLIGLGNDLPDSLALNPLGTAAFALTYVVTQRLAGAWPAAVASGLHGLVWGLLIAVANSAPVAHHVPFALLATSATLSGSTGGLGVVWWGPRVLYGAGTVWNTWLYRIEVQRADATSSVFRWHSAFWAEDQRQPLPGLDQHLLLVLQRYPHEGQQALAYLAEDAQRWAAQEAQIERDAQRCEQCTDVDALRHLHCTLAPSTPDDPVSALLSQFSYVSHDVDAALHRGSSFTQHLALTAVLRRLEGLKGDLLRSHARYAARLLPIARRWHQLLADYTHTLAHAAAVRQEIQSPYVVGVPLTRQDAIFVGRPDVSARLEPLLGVQRHAPLLLYGQRRMGKTSLLCNLGRQLDSTIVPLFVDLQGPATHATSEAGFLYNLARSMVDSAYEQRHLTLPALPREALTADPFTRFDEWLDEVEQALAYRTALLALDEFEALERAISRGHFEADAVLGMLRHLIQHRPRFRVLLAGARTLDELQYWASYLINVQVVPISYLTEGQARQLIERPIADFPLRYEPTASRHIWDLTHGHPYLIQLLCAELVALKNEQPLASRHLACWDDVEAAVPKALASGRLFFLSIAQQEVDSAGLALLRFLAARGAGAVVSRDDLACQFPGALDEGLCLPLRREIIEPVAAGYRFQVELMRRWFGTPRGPLAG